MAARRQQASCVVQARAIVAEFFGHANAIGILRLREHSRASKRLDVEALIKELARIFKVPAR